MTRNPLSRPTPPHPQLYEIDFVSLSYTRCSEDVDEARQFLDGAGLGSTRIFAKLESRQVRAARRCSARGGGRRV